MYKHKLNLRNTVAATICFAGITMMFSCERPQVTFKEPQPTNTENISEFPKSLRGQYLSVEDGSILIIGNKLMQRIYDFDYKIHPNELDSTQQIVGDTVIDFEINEKIPIRRDGDSLVIHIHRIDTLFLMDYDNVVRKFKGYFFLNIRWGKESWEVKKMQLKKGQLIVSRISTKEEIENLKKITETQQDTVSSHEFTVKKKQFKEFVKNEGFRNSEIFIKQK